MKIGRYTEDEILEYMTDREGSFLGRSMYDAIFDKIHALITENEQLNKQLDYLRSGEYLNQLKFERNMLEDIVQNMEVSKEDKEFIDMTHRNTELLEENRQLKESIEIIQEMVCTIEHNIDKYEEIGTENHFEYAQNKINELKDYLYDLLKGNNNEL